MMIWRSCALLVGLTGCVLLPRSQKLPDNNETTVALYTGGLGHPIEKIARHPWFAVRHKGQTEWKTYEVGGGSTTTDPAHNSPYVEPYLEKVWRGEEGERAAACIEKIGSSVREQIERDYFYPGPNSNTFGDVILRRCKLSASLPATALGKDWRGLVGASITSERTGVQIETAAFGFKIGLKEGVEVHLIGLSFGVDLWPPALIIPIGPGRLGFADR